MIMSKAMSAKELIAWREHFKVNQIELSELLGVTRTCVHYWETSQRSIPATTVKILRLIKKYPQVYQLVKEL